EEHEVEAIILGCTHYPFLLEAIRDLVSPQIVLLDSAEMLANQIISDLGLNLDPQLLQDSVSEIYCWHRNQLFTTGNASLFASTAAVCLGRTGSALVAPGVVSHVPLESITNSMARA